MECSLSALSPGDVLHGKRYRLLKQLHTPLSEQEWRADWLASDAHFSDRTVLLHQINTPSDQEKSIQTITQHLTELARHPGFLPVLDVFQEQGEDYIVQLYPEGKSLASLLEQQGGLLPEHQIVEYGVQVCSMLSQLTQSHPPLPTGSLSPEMILISPERRQVWLLHFPCFSSQTAQQEKGTIDGLAPEQSSVSSALYSFAAILHRALAGYAPQKQQPVSYPPVRILNPSVTPQMEAILIRALHSSHSQRLTDPSLMQQELSRLIASSPSPSLTSVPPASISLAMEKTQISQGPFQKRRGKLAIAVGLICVIFLLPLTFIFASLLTSNVSSSASPVAQQYHRALNQELALEQQTFRTKGLGLSDGRLAFDVYSGRTQADINLKQHAALSLQQGNTRNALSLLTQATAADPADGEAQIYNEDLYILESGVPSISIVLGLPLDNDPADLAFDRPDLEGAFLAQHEINTKGLLPHGMRLRLLIANSGSEDADATTVAQFIANRVVKAGNPDHIVAVVGWPSSQATIDARDILAAIHLPLVSQTASSVQLSGGNPYFFRVNPPDDLQGKTLGAVAVHRFHAKTILVLQDTTNPYSVSLASAFSKYLKANQATVINEPGNFTLSTTAVAQYEQTTIPYAIAKKADLIFLAGYDVDGIRLAHALGEAARANPMSSFLANLKILGGDAIDTNLLLGLGSGPDATIAMNFPQDMQKLIFSSFAHRDEWTLLSVPREQQPDFFATWSKIYQHAHPPAENASLPEDGPLLTYDAVQVLAKATTSVSGSLTGQSVRDALASLGHGNVPAFQGISGRISFDAQGNPIDKALVLLNVEKRNGQNMIVLYQIAGKFF